MSKGEETRNEIIERALTLAGQIGLEALSLGTLAEALQLSKSGLYAHFKSKEALQLAVMQRAIERFTAEVVLPMLAEPRGEPRVRQLFAHYLDWISGQERNGVCLFIAFAQEFDDRPGAVRDRVVQSQRDWRQTIARAAHLAIEIGHFRADLDPQQFAFEFVGIVMTFQQSFKLLEDAHARQRAQEAFAALVARSRRDHAG